MSNVKWFQQRLDALGSSINQWPERDHQRATALLSQSQDARNLLRQAEAFEAALRRAGPDAPSADLRDRILASLPDRREHQRVRGSLLGWKWTWPQGLAAAAASIALSFFVGTYSWELVLPTDDLVTEATTAVQSGTETIDGILYGFVLYEDGV